MRVRVAPSDAVAGGAAAAPQQASRGKPLRVHVATWNLGEATPPAQLGALLAEDADGACAHAYLCQSHGVQRFAPVQSRHTGPYRHG